VVFLFFLISKGIQRKVDVELLESLPFTRFMQECKQASKKKHPLSQGFLIG
jgi:hypothetical protein